MRNNIIAMLAFLLLLMSCGDRKEARIEIVEDKMIMLKEDLNEWNKLTQQILSDQYVNANLGKLIKPASLNGSLKEQLIDRDVLNISAQKNGDCKEVEFVTGWTSYPIVTLYLTWTNCDSTQTQQGYYLDNFNTNFIEVWGVGNNWLIWTDSDFI